MTGSHGGGPVLSTSVWLRGIFYKERIKLCKVWFVLLLANLGLVLMAYSWMRYLFRQNHAEIVWYWVMSLERIMFEDMRYVPLVTGVLLACFQFLPEMRGERLRLSLHLPVPSNIVILAHLMAGLGALALVFCLDMAVIGGGASLFFPRETVQTVLMTALPWFMAGITVYLGVAQALLEPSLRLRLVLLCLVAGLAAPMAGHSTPGLAPTAVAYCFLVPALLLFSTLLPGYNFRYRRAEQ